MRCFVYDWDGDKTVLNVDKMLYAIYEDKLEGPSVEIVFEDDTMTYIFGSQADSFWRYITAGAVVAKEA